MSNNSHKKFVKERVFQKLKNSICKDDFERAVFDLAEKKSHATKLEFWIFCSGIEACLELSDEELLKLKEIKKQI